MAELEASIKINHPDIVCITEVKPKNCRNGYEIDESYNIVGYHLSKNDQGRGIIIYTANHLLASEIETNAPYVCSLWTNIQITKSHNIIIGTIYRSPNSDHENNDKLTILLQETSSISHTHLSINGDFNLKQID